MNNNKISKFVNPIRSLKLRVFVVIMLAIIIPALASSIFIIPAILGLGVSGFKLYKSIIKDNRKENIKLEILRHTVFSLIMLILLLIASLIEVFISINFLKVIIKYF